MKAAKTPGEGVNGMVNGETRRRPAARLQRRVSRVMSGREKRCARASRLVVLQLTRERVETRVSRGLPVSISTTLHMRKRTRPVASPPGPYLSSETKDYNTLQCKRKMGRPRAEIYRHVHDRSRRAHLVGRGASTRRAVGRGRILVVVAPLSLLLDVLSADLVHVRVLQIVARGRPQHANREQHARVEEVPEGVKRPENMPRLVLPTGEDE